ncbi:MAG: helix-turn-helix transcriptional regulator [Eubacterium sp.]|nr:helix-turn-helix transcriptional regulator [Eubacterium sp.]
MNKPLEIIKQEIKKYLQQHYIPEEDMLLGAPSTIDENIIDEDDFDLECKLEMYKPKRKVYLSNVAMPPMGAKESMGLEESAPPSRPRKRRIDDLMDELDETFSQRLLRLIEERGLTDSEVYNKAFVDRRHFSKIRNDEDYTPTKKTVLAFAIALGLSLDETKDLLDTAGFSLSRSSKRDVIVRYFLEQGIYDMFEINEVLYDYGEPIFE